ncbi:MAG: Holliday junction branch migration protein RuvA [Chloroflexota bacterium]
MIVTISGKVSHVGRSNVTIEVGGVGVLVNVPLPLCERFHPGETIFLHTYLVVREEVLDLYGFETTEGRELFSLLLGVNGVGPRLSLAVLSTLTPDNIRAAVYHKQPEVFCRVPGVGNKTAQKILLHLQDRLPVKEGIEAVMFTDMDTEVLNALTALGYSVVEAQAAIQSIPKDAPQDVEERLRLALRYYFSP